MGRRLLCIYALCDQDATPQLRLFAWATIRQGSEIILIWGYTDRRAAELYVCHTGIFI